MASYEALTTAESNKDIPFTILESLSKKDVEYFLELMDEKIEKRKDVFVQRSEASTNRFIQSLKSLFSYLTTESEDKTGECYFYRNVMAKVRTPRKTESAARRAKRISSQILDKDEMDGLLEFVRNEYEQWLDSSHAASFFKRNRIRDIAIISLF